MGSDVLLQPSTLQADNHKKRTGFGPHLRRENAGQSWQDGSAETARSAFMGAMCCCNPAPFKRIITKSGQVLVRSCGERAQASHGKTDPQKQPGALSWERCAAATQHPSSG